MRIAVAQTSTGIDPATNARNLVSLVAEAARGGANIVFTPEMSGLLERNRKKAAGHIVCEEADGVLAAVREAARAHGIWVALGSLALCADTAGKWVNRSFVIDAMGKIRARYDKIHLFDVDLPDGESWRESAAFDPGKAPALCDTPAGMLGLSVCYDVRFPALYSALSGAGATVLSVPAAFTVPTGKAHWHTLLRARAIENACWIVAAAQTGLHEDGRTTFGHSLVIDPWGEVILDMGSEPGLGFAEIDPEIAKSVRARIPVLEHRRPIPQISGRS